MAGKRRYVVDGSSWLPSLAPALNHDPPHWDVEIRHLDKQSAEEVPGDSGGTPSPQPEGGDTRVLKAHKAILAANSGFFAKKLSPEWGAQAGSNSEVEIRADEVDLESLVAVLRSIYGVPFDIDAGNVYGIHAAANFLEMERLSYECCEFLKDELTVENVLSTWRYCGMDFPGSDTLKECCEAMIYENFQKIYSNPGFGDLKSSEIKHLISRSSLSVKSEVEMVDAVLRWLNRSWSANFKSCREVFEHVRWNMVTRMDMVKLKSAEEFGELECSSDEESLVKMKVLELLVAPQRNMKKLGSEEPSFTSSAQQNASVSPPPKLFVFHQYGYNTHNEQFTFRHYCSTSHEWTEGLQNWIAPGGLINGRENAHHTQLLDLFSFRGYIVVITFREFDCPNRIEVTAHVFDPQCCGFIKHVEIRVPDRFLPGIKFTVRFSEPYICVELREYAILMYDMRLLFPAFKELAPHDMVSMPCCKEITIENLVSCIRLPQMFYFKGDLYVIFDNFKTGKELHVFDVGSGELKSDPYNSLNRMYQECRGRNCRYLFAVDEVMYSAANRYSCPACFSKFQYLSPLSGSGGWVDGPDLLHGEAFCVRSHFVLDGRLYLLGEYCLDTFSFQSIDLGDFSAGWKAGAPLGLEGASGTMKQWDWIFFV